MARAAASRGTTAATGESVAATTSSAPQSATATSALGGSTDALSGSSPGPAPAASSSGTANVPAMTSIPAPASRLGQSSSAQSSSSSPPIPGSISAAARRESLSQRPTPSGAVAAPSPFAPSSRGRGSTAAAALSTQSVPSAAAASLFGFEHAGQSSRSVLGAGPASSGSFASGSAGSRAAPASTDSNSGRSAAQRISFGLHAVHGSPRTNQAGGLNGPGASGTSLWSSAPGYASPARSGINAAASALQHGLAGAAQGSWALADPAGWSGESSAPAALKAFEEDTITSFRWRISDLRLLRDEVEGSALPSDGGRSISAGAGKSEVWTTQPIFGDGKWKLELVRTSRGAGDASAVEEETESSVQGRGNTVLSVYLTAMLLDYAPPDVFIVASIFVGIAAAGRSPSIKTSRNGGFVWRHHASHTFARDEGEFWECHDLPSLSELLQHQAVAKQNAIELTIQISTGPRVAHLHDSIANRSTNHSVFEDEHSHSVPRALVNGLEGLLDCSATGDVILLVKERGLKLAPNGAGERVVETGPFQGSRGTIPAGAETVTRDRVLWAHSSILRARGEFWADMLASSFAEGVEHDLAEAYGGRRVRVLRLPDADFAAAYSLLRWLYVNEVDFADDSNQPISGESYGLLDDSHWVDEQEEEGAQTVPDWTWRTGNREDSDAHIEDAEHSTPQNQVQQHHLHTANRPVSNRVSYGSIGSSVGAGAEASQAVPASPPTTLPRPRRPGEYDPRASRAAVTATSSHTPGESAAARAPTLGSVLSQDPHSHPVTDLVPASALTIYRLAHRCAQDSLAELARAHVVASLDPQSAFPTFLATGLYAELHADVKSYLLANWTAVSHSEAFERSMDEICSGQWGDAASRSLREFMRALTPFSAPQGRSR